MSNNKTKSVLGIFFIIAVLFIVFLVFAFYTISNLKSTSGFIDDEASEKPIAVVEVNGTIMSSKKIIKKLLKAEKDKKVKAIIVRVNSPGGAVGPTQEIYEEIIRIDKEKPVYSSFGSIAASGGYYIGAATREIYSNSGTLTGSIGVIMNFINLSELYKFVKVQPKVIKAGKYKDIGNQSRDMTSEEKALLDELIKENHEKFIQDIFSIRKDKIKGGLEGLREYAQGQIFSGEGAQNRGLVDHIGSLHTAARKIHKELKIKEKFGIKYIKLKRDLKFSEIIGGINESVEDIKFEVRNQDVPMFLFKR